MVKVATLAIADLPADVSSLSFEFYLSASDIATIGDSTLTPGQLVRHTDGQCDEDISPPYFQYIYILYLCMVDMYTRVYMW